MAVWDRWFGKRAATAPAPEPATPAPPPEFPYPLVAVPGASAVEEWKRLRELWRAEGACPVLLGDREEVSRMREPLANEESGAADKIIRMAADRRAEEFLAERLREQQEIHEDDPEITLENGLVAPRGEWPPIPSPSQLGAHQDLRSGKYKPLVYVARIPTARPYEIFAYLSYGGWNECPWATDQVAVHRRWYELYGAEPWAVVDDVVECWVARPPQEGEAAAALAREQYLYCADIVDQGTTTILALASALKGSDAWFFWWD